MSERLYDYMKITDLKDMLKKSGKKYADKIAYKINVSKHNPSRSKTNGRCLRNSFNGYGAKR